MECLTFCGKMVKIMGEFCQICLGQCNLNFIEKEWWQSTLMLDTICLLTLGQFSASFSQDVDFNI